MKCFSYVWSMTLGSIKEAAAKLLYSLGDDARINAGAQNFLAHGTHLMWWMLYLELLETTPESEVGVAMTLAWGCAKDGHQRRGVGTSRSHRLW